jgi:hypothetical protein
MSEKDFMRVTAEINYLNLCKVLGFPGGDYEKCRLLIPYAVWLL